MRCAPTATLAERLTARTAPANPAGCREWTGARNSAGYGQLRVAGKPLYAHRAAYETYVGPIPDGLQIDHLCRNRACVNPEHLEPVTAKENTRRGTSPSALASQLNRCKAGHDLRVHGYVRPDGGGRVCRECRNRRQNAARKVRL